MAGPKTAFLVTAHDQPLIARRLLDRLEVPWARTFVHVDRKVDIRPFRTGYSGGATFLPDSRRVPVYWGGFSIAQAMLNMIEYALEEMPDLERVVTLSGVDYPIRPLDEIGRFFARHPDVEFMRVDRDVNPNRTQIHDWYIRRRFLGDNYYFNPKSSPVPALAAAARLVARMFPRTYIPGLQIYHGGCWWSLSRRGLDDLVGYFRRPSGPSGLVPPGPLGGRARLPDRPQGDAERQPHHPGPDHPEAAPGGREPVPARGPLHRLARRRPASEEPHPRRPPRPARLAGPVRPQDAQPRVAAPARPPRRGGRRPLRQARRPAGRRIAPDASPFGRAGASRRPACCRASPRRRDPEKVPTFRVHADCGAHLPAGGRRADRNPSPPLGSAIPSRPRTHFPRQPSCRGGPKGRRSGEHAGRRERGRRGDAAAARGRPCSDMSAVMVPGFCPARPERTGLRIGRGMRTPRLVIDPMLASWRAAPSFDAESVDSSFPRPRTMRRHAEDDATPVAPVRRGRP